MTDSIERRVEPEWHDVFQVTQLTRGSALEAAVGVDLVFVAQGSSSQTHRHNTAETVLYFTEGEAVVGIGDDEVPVVAGDRIAIGKGLFHNVRTPNASCCFISVQMPPILNGTTRFRDLEPRDDG